MTIRPYAIRTRFGWCEVSASYKGLCSLSKPQEVPIDGYKYHELEEALEEYFSGRVVDFSIFPVDLSSLTPFQRSVLEEVRNIKWGGVAFYEEIGERLGGNNLARAVGQALARNPLPIIIPCHRVIRKDGSLGGFTWGLEWKVRLLELERKEVKNDV
ncbi:methylated-DNA--[protein]-cysteine S-methyltransferase [bacterium]|nr:methylated-DNA--[protein]-cysteine S-methyltransferase [bacterium]